LLSTRSQRLRLPTSLREARILSSTLYKIYSLEE
jgi:hypothetical protein